MELLQAGMQKPAGFCSPPTYPAITTIRGRGRSRSVSDFEEMRFVFALQCGTQLNPWFCPMNIKSRLTLLADTETWVPDSQCEPPVLWDRRVQKRCEFHCFYVTVSESYQIRYTIKKPHVEYVNRSTLCRARIVFSYTKVTLGENLSTKTLQEGSRLK